MFMLLSFQECECDLVNGETVKISVFIVLQWPYKICQTELYQLYL